MTTSFVSSFRRRLLGGVVVVILAAVAVFWWIWSGRSETTDDAQVDGHLHAISSRITGSVVRIDPDIQSNHFVNAGALLLELDPTDYDVALAQARAALTMSEAAHRAAVAEIPITRTTAFSQLDLARHNTAEAERRVEAELANLVNAQHRFEHDSVVYARAERDRERYRALVDKREISRSEYDARESEAQAALETLEGDRASVAAAEQEIAAAKSRVAQKQAETAGARSAPDRLADAKARAEAAAGEVQQARANVRAAELNLRYTKICAPVSGVIGRKTVEVGHRVQPGQTLLVIVPVDDIWVTANFKETQVRRMRPGLPVNVHVDAFGRDYAATVQDLPAAVGTLFSLLPPENASGNFVKVVQRLPVRVRLNDGQDPDHRLRPGMSAEAKVSFE
jgi:membrane fusion protein (multidrug efflux system)